MKLPQSVFNDLVNNVPCSDDEEEDRECILQYSLDESLDSGSEDFDGNENF